MKHLLYLPTSIFSILILLDCCTYEADLDIRSEEVTYNVSQSSIQNFPYSNFDSVIFIDSLNNECIFKVSECKSQYLATLDPIQKQKDEELINYILRHERYGCDISCDSLNLKFHVEIKAEPDKFSIAQRGVKDVLTVYKTNNNVIHKNSMTSVFFFTVDQRNHSGKNKDTSFKQSIILGEQYFNVYNANSHCKNEINMMYNFKNGILSFLEENGNYWRFKEAVVKNGL